MIIAIKDVYMPVLTEEDIKAVAEILTEKRDALTKSFDFRNMSEEELNHLNDEYNKLSTLKAKFQSNTFRVS